MAKQAGSPAQIEAFANRLTEACIKACRAEGTVGDAMAYVRLEGDYSFAKEGELTLDLAVDADIPVELPLDAEVGTGLGKQRKKAGGGTLVVQYKVEVKTKA